MKKKLALLLLAAALGVSVYFGWVWLDGNTDHSGWVTTEDGSFYRDYDGDYVTGWQTIEGVRYYFHEVFEPKGALATGWVDVDGKHYYMDEKGVAVTGWQTIDGWELCFGIDGTMLTGWQVKDGVRCYLSSDGTPASGWLEENGVRFYLDETGTPVTGWQQLEGMRYYFQENGAMLTGWAQFGEGRYYFRDDGTMHTGWLEEKGKRYYFDEAGVMQTGWLEQDGNRYFLLAAGDAAVGPLQIEGQTYYFSPSGVHILLVNPWNSVPGWYTPDLKWVENGPYQMDAVCLDALLKMMNDCRAAGHAPMIASGYRTHDIQVFLYNRKVNYFLDLGFDLPTAQVEAAKIVAVPGTSEHQLGLAVDIIDSYYTNMDDAQADTATQKWLMEHCWEYGFILRYPIGTTDVTGIIYEPWHYRYVGREIALEIRDLGVTLEEYLGFKPVTE